MQKILQKYNGRQKQKQKQIPITMKLQREKYIIQGKSDKRVQEKKGFSSEQVRNNFMEACANQLP